MSRRVCCGLLAVALALLPASLAAQVPSDRLLATEGPWPRVRANDNRTPAGVDRDGVREVHLEALWADWRPETPDGPGLRVVALAEAGRAPEIPAPLLRVRTGTRLRVHLHNTLPDSALTVFGLQTRPAAGPDSLVVAPGATATVTFDAGAPGTYFYRVRPGRLPPDEEREQLAGALVVDPPGGAPPDRVFVINIFSTPVDTTVSATGFLEALTINGLSWPHTERLLPAVGDTLRWRVVNASRRVHPMHLHGFFFDVTARGTRDEDHRYAPEDRRAVVTERMSGGTTMAMTWVPRRPGNWLFHCHLSFHVAPAIRLPRPASADHSHMAGLVLGIEVQPGPSDLIERGAPRRFTLYAHDYPADTLHAHGFSLASDAAPHEVPGPVLVLRQYQATYVTVENRMRVPTGVHWHGLELDSWADGVPGWSASDGRVSPVIPPGGSFTYKLSSMRPGTFIYHSHLDDINQLTGGLYGALLVLPEGVDYDPATDHVAVVGWNDPAPETLADFAWNGRATQPVQHAVVGERHRIRVINIAPAGTITARMVQGEAVVPLVTLAKDGADLPPHQQVPVEAGAPMGVGETADFGFTPTAPGTYELVIGYGPGFGWRQTWVVAAADAR